MSVRITSTEHIKQFPPVPTDKLLYFYFYFYYRSNCQIVCVSVCVYVFQWGSQTTTGWGTQTPKGKCTYVCMWPKGQEGWRLRRMLLSSSVILRTLPPFSPLHTSKQPHRIKISHCWTYTKRQGFSQWGDTSNIFATFKDLFDIERLRGFINADLNLNYICSKAD